MHLVCIFYAIVVHVFLDLTNNARRPRRIFQDHVVPGHEDTVVKIDVGSNAIQSIEEGVFDAFGKLQVLVLSNNYLVSVDIRK